MNKYTTTLKYTHADALTGYLRQIHAKFERYESDDLTRIEIDADGLNITDIDDFLTALKRGKVYEISRTPSRLSGRTHYTLGTLSSLTKEFNYLLHGLKPRRIDTLVKALNDTQKGNEHTYTHAYFDYHTIL